MEEDCTVLYVAKLRFPLCKAQSLDSVALLKKIYLNLENDGLMSFFNVIQTNSERDKKNNETPKLPEENVSKKDHKEENKIILQRHRLKKILKEHG